MRRSGLAVLSAIAVAGLLVACQVFAVRMPSHATAGSSIVIEMDLRQVLSDANPYTAAHCARLPNSWVITASTYSRTRTGVTTTGALTAAVTEATALNTSQPLADHSWRCFQAPSASYAVNDFGTARLTVTVATQGSYTLPFVITYSDGTGTVAATATRHFTVDAVPDWRFESAPLARPSSLTDWRAVEPISDLGFSAIDVAGTLHRTLDGGVSWTAATVTGSFNLYALARNTGRVVVTGSGGAIFSSTAGDLGPYAPRVSNTTQAITAACSFGTRFFVFGDAGYVASSADAVTWLNATIPSVGNIEACVSVPDVGVFAATSTGQVFRVAQIGSTPTVFEQTTASTAALTAIAYVASPVEKLVVAGANTAFERPLTDSAWSAVAPPSVSAPLRMRVFGDTIYAVGSNGTFVGSPTGTFAWTDYGSGTSASLNDVLVTGRVSVLTGSSGVLLRIGVPELAFDGDALALPRTGPAVATSATIAIRNAGKGNLYLGAPVVTAPFTATYDCDGTLVEGEECDVTVSLTSGTRGIFAGTLTVPSSSAIQRTVALSGLVGDDATIAATLDGSTPVTTVDFGNVAVGATASRTVQVRNVGDALLTVGALGSLVAPVTPFAITDNQCTGQVLAGGATCPITVRFTPFGRDGVAQAFDVASSDATRPNLVVQLVGVGTPPGALRVPETLRFEDTPVGDSQQLQLVVRNVGQGPLDVTRLAVDGDGDFTIVDATPFTIPPGESAERTLRFAPTTEGERTGRLVIGTNDPFAPDQGVTMTAIALAESHATKDGGCAATTPSWLGLLATCAACAAYRCARRPRHHRAPNHA